MVIHDIALAQEFYMSWKQSCQTDWKGPQDIMRQFRKGTKTSSTDGDIPSSANSQFTLKCFDTLPTIFCCMEELHRPAQIMHAARGNSQLNGIVIRSMCMCFLLEGNRFPEFCLFCAVVDFWVSIFLVMEETWIYPRKNTCSSGMFIKVVGGRFNPICQILFQVFIDLLIKGSMVNT